MASVPIAILRSPNGTSTDIAKANIKCNSTILRSVLKSVTQEIPTKTLRLIIININLI